MHKKLTGYGLFILCLSFFSSCSKEEEPEVIYNVNRINMMRLINEKRVSGCKCGETDMPPVSALTWNSLLAKAAYNHSVDMFERKQLAHSFPGGPSVSERISAAGYNFEIYGENAAMGYGSEEAVIAGWLQSEGHCKNIMNKNFTEVGVAREGNYWTMNLAKPAKKN